MTEKIPEKKREQIYSWKYHVTTEHTDKATQMLKLSHVWNLWLDYAYFVYNYAPKKRTLLGSQGTRQNLTFHVLFYVLLQSDIGLEMSQRSRTLKKWQSEDPSKDWRSLSTQT